MDESKRIYNSINDIAIFFRSEDIQFQEEVIKEYNHIMGYVENMDYNRYSEFSDTIYESILYLAIYNVYKDILPINVIAERIQCYYLNKIDKSMKENLCEQGKRMFEDDYIKSIKKQADQSMEKKFTDDYIVEFVESDGRFTYGNNTYQCPIHLIYKNNGGSEFLKFICAIDFIRSSFLRSGLERTECLAYGNNCCSFRWTKDSEPKYCKEEILVKIN